MKIDKSPEHTRYLKISELLSPYLPEMEIAVDYRTSDNDGARIDKAVALDSVVMPVLANAMNNYTKGCALYGELTLLLQKTGKHLDPLERQQIEKALRDNIPSLS